MMRTIVVLAGLCTVLALAALPLSPPIGAPAVTAATAVDAFAPVLVNPAIIDLQAVGLPTLTQPPAGQGLRLVFMSADRRAMLQALAAGQMPPPAYHLRL